MKRKKLNQVIQKFFVLIMAFFISLSSVVTPATFAEGNQPVAGLLSLDNVTIDSFDIIDGANGDAKIEYKKQGDGDYNSYLTDPSKFGTVLCQNQKNSQLSLKMGIRYRGEEAIKEGDKLEIPAYLGVELKNASFALQPLRDVSGHEIGTYTYNQGNFKLSFSGDYIKNNSVKEVASTLTIGIVSVPNTTQGEGEDIEITPIYGKLGNETIIAGYEKKKRENPTGPRKIQNVEGDLTEDDELLAEIKPVNLRLAGDELSLDNVRIISFKIIEVSRGDREIDYRVSDNQPEFDNFSNDPTKFSNAICEDGKFSKLKLELSMEYNGTNPIKEGDILNIPANLEQALASFSEQALFDGTNHQLGTWEYKRGVISIKFGGDYIKNNQITKVTASFKTGDIAGYLNAYGQTFNKGERVAARGKIGKNDFVAAWEKEHVQASVVGKTDRHMSKGGSGTDKNINWYYSVFTDIANISGKEYYCPFLLENNGKYTAKALTRLYIEDTFHDVIAPPNLSKDSSIILSGINDAGEVISGWYSINLPSSLLTKVEQGARTRDEVKQALKAGEYCIYNNKDETYTLMLKWWDTNDSNGLTYDQIPSIKSAGGVGNLLKTRYKSIFGNVSDETITRINNLYKGKAIQNFRIYADAKYTPVKEVTKIPNTLKITSDQGDFNIKGVATLTPPVGIADAPADPLTIKLIKTDVKTGANLSDGFKFKLQTSTDDGVTWKDVNVIQDMVEKGTLNGDGTLSPDKGEVQVRRLIGGQKYRFLETSHAEGYMDVAENNANPNDAKHPTSANSRVVDINNQGKGKVVVMYNKRISEKIEIHVNKEWVGPKSNSVTIKLIADGKEVPGKILVLNNDNNWRGKFTNIEKNNDNGDEIQYDVAEVKLQNYESKKEGNAKTGFTITNKNIEKISIPVEKKWEGEELDSVRVRLFADGKEVTYKDLNKANNWRWTFDNHDKYNEQGQEIKYTVKEDKIEGYNVIITGDAKTGFVITNIKNVPPKKEVFKGNETTNIDGKEVKPGEILTYKITYKNTTGKEQKVVIEDKIPEFTEYVNNSADNGGLYSNGTITWTRENLGNGETFEVTFKVKVKESASGEKLTNEALVKAGNNNLKTNPTSNPVPETPPTKPKKEVFKGTETTNIDGKEVKPGEILTYKVSYQNTTGKVQKVVIEDKIPEFTEYVDSSADNGGVYSNGTITWTKSSLGNGETYEVTFKVKVKESAGGEKLTNEALVKASNNNLKTNPTNNPVPETPPTPPKKEVFKGSETTNIDGNQVKPGEILTYKVTYKNITGKAQKVVIEDKIPEFTEYVDNSADNGGVYSGGTITWTKEKVSNGETFEVTFKVKVKESAGGENLKNEALVKAGKNDLKTNPTNNPVPETPPTPPKKEVFKGSETTNIDGKQVNPGEILTYKITYKNTTGKEQKVVIEDKIPEFTEYVNNSADNGGIYSGGTITWTKEKVSNGETFEVTFKVKVKESAGGENLKNEALVKAGKNDLKTNPTNNPVPETPPTKPKKEVFKGSTTTNIDGKEVKSGEILTYKITYKNITGKVQKVVIEDKIPEFTEYVDNSADNGGVYSGGKITWTKASLGNGETYEVTFKVKVKESAGGEKLTNEALVKAGKNDLKTNPTSNPVPETPPTKPKKEVFKGTETTNIDGKQVNPGDILTYKITYKNTTGKVQKVVIEDKIPEFTEYVDNSADNGGVYSNGTITWTKENLGNGETFEVTFKVKVKESASGENIKNEALVKTGNNNLKTNTTNNPVPETPTKPKKEVFKGDTTTNIDGKQVNPGDILTYKITYKNTTRKEQDVVITDKIPTHTAYIENSADNSGVYKDGIITWKKKLLAGESMTVSFKVKVNNNIDGVTLKNMAKVNDGKNDYETNETHNPTPEKTVPNKPTTPNTPDDIIKRLPKTGDGLDPARYAGLFAIPGSILLFFELRRRKNLNK